MKKRFVVLITIMVFTLLLVGLTSCKEKNKVETPSDSTPSTQEPSNNNDNPDQETEVSKELLFTEIKENGVIVGYKVSGLTDKTIKEIIIPRTCNNLPVTSIGSYAFEDCSSLTSITISDSVTSIGDNAFRDCSSLAKVYYNGTIEDWCKISFNSTSSTCTPMNYAKHFYLKKDNDWEEVTSIEIPNGIVNIGQYQFYGFNNVTSIIISDGVTGIGDRAFDGCINLASITIPDSVIHIVDYAFADCINLDKVYYNGTIEDWCKISFNGSTSTPMRYANHFYLKKDNDWEEVTSIEIPNGIVNIGKYQFYGFNNVISITIPDSVTSIGSYAFDGCSSLTSVTIGDSVTSIGNYAFYNCSGLTSMTIPNSVTSIGYGAFQDCSSLTSITIPDSVPSIEEYAFYNCGCLTSVTIGNNVTSIGNSAFYNCSKLDKIYYSGTIEDWCKISLSSTPMGYANHFYLKKDNDWEEVTSIEIPDSITKIGYSQFYGFNNVTSITIPDSVTSIGNYAFDGCYKLVEIYNYSGLKLSIGSIDYGYIAEHAKIIHTKEEPSIIKTTEDGLYDYIVLDGKYYLISYKGEESDITLPNGLEGNNYEINQYAFSYCRSLTSIIIPNSVTSIGNNAFYGCSSLQSMTIPFIGNGSDQSHFGYIFGASSYKWNDIFVPTTLKEVIITDVTSIGGFYNCSSLTSITLPDSVTSIRDSAFYNCSSLTSITIPDSVTSIGDNAFKDCSKLDKVYYNGIIEDWCKISFSYFDFNPFRYTYSNPMGYANHFYLKKDNDWEEVTSIEIPNTITKIGDYQFDGFNNVTSITIADSVTSIGSRAFENCSSLTSVTIGSSVTSIGDSAFSNCYKLIEIYNYSRLKLTIGSYNYGYIAGYAKVIHTQEEPSIIKATEDGLYDYIVLDYEYYLLSYKGTERNITLPNDLEGYNYEIYQGAFRGYNGLTNIAIPDSVTNIGDYAFYNCSNITSIIIPISVTSIGDYAFYNCSNLTSIIIPGSNLMSIIIPDSVTSIGKDAFYNCSKLDKVYYNGTIEDWCKISFNSSTSTPMEYANHFYLKKNNDWEEVKSIEIPNDIEEIGDYQFYGFNNVTSITIPNSVTSVGNYAFSSCSNLINVTIGDVTSIGDYAFSSCSNLINVTIGDVTSIGDYAFYGCSNLINVTIGDVTNIGSDAFYGCSNLINVTIGDVTNIGSDAFYGCSKLDKVYYGGTIEDWCKISFSDSDSNPMGFAKHFYLKKNNDWEEVTSVEIPNGIVNIGKYQFYGFSNVTSITIPDSVTSIRGSAFLYCSKLDKVYYGGTIEDWCKINFAGNIFSSSNSKHFCLKKNNDWEEVTSIEIPNSIEEIGDYQFYGFSNVTSITIPDSVTNIGDYAFSNCSNITSIIIPISVTSIGVSAFRNCSSLTSVTIPDSVTSIGVSAFENCSSLTNITIPDSVTSIGDSAFSNCYKLIEIYNYSRLKLTIGSYNYGYIAGYAKVIHTQEEPSIIKATKDGLYDYMVLEGKYYLLSYNGKESDITLPKDLEGNNYEIYDYAFYNCSSLTSVTIGDSVTSIGSDAFEYCYKLVEIYNYSSLKLTVGSENNGHIAEYAKIIHTKEEPSIIKTTEDGLYEYMVLDGKYYLISYKGKESDITLPSDLEGNNYEICRYAFRDCSILTNVTIGDSVTSIGNYAFYNCSSLTSVTVGDSVTSIGNYAFYNCSSLTSVTVGDSVTSIGNNAFQNCSSLDKVYYDGTIEDWCKISFNSSISNPMYYANHFYLKKDNDWEEVTSIEIPDSITEIGYSQFYGFNNVTSIIMPNSVTSIGNYAFYNCSKLDKIYYDGAIEDWCKISFSDSDSNPMMYAKHFYLKKDNDWEEVTSIEIPDSITEIGDSQFYGFNNVTSITIPDSVTNIGDYAFSNCSSLISIIIPNDVTNIEQGAFAGCINLKYVTIGNNVTSIGSGAFSNCSSLKRVYYNGTKNKWDFIKIDFDGNSNLTIHYYNNVKPADDGYKYWYYDASGNIVEW